MCTDALAYHHWWHQFYPESKFDQAVEPYLHLPTADFGWLYGARTALQKILGGKKMNAQSFAKLEIREKRGTITLNSLRRAAEAIDCELVYAIRPKRRMRFSRLIWTELAREAEKHPWINKSTSKHRAIAWIAAELFYDGEFRRKKGWTERKTVPDKVRADKIRRPKSPILNPSFRDPSRGGADRSPGA